MTTYQTVGSNKNDNKEMMAKRRGIKAQAKPSIQPKHHSVSPQTKRSEKRGKVWKQTDKMSTTVRKSLPTLMYCPNLDRHSIILSSTHLSNNRKPGHVVCLVLCGCLLPPVSCPPFLVLQWQQHHPVEHRVVPSSVHLHEFIFLLKADATVTGTVPVLWLRRAIASAVRPTASAVEARA